MKKLVGVTLLFVIEGDEKLKALIESYVFKCTDYNEFVNELDLVVKKRKERVKTNVHGHSYIGVEDIFTIVGPVDKGALLGRNTDWEITLKELKGVVTTSDNFTFHKQLENFNGKWFIAQPVYYVEAKKAENSRAIFCNALIESTDPTTIAEKAEFIANSSEFKKKIELCDYEDLKIDELKLVGIEDILVIYDDILQGEPFMKLYKEIDDKESVFNLVVDNDQIEQFFEG